MVAIGREQAGAEGYGVVIGEKYTSAPILARTVLARVQQYLGTGTAQAARESPAAERTERGDIRPPAFRERGAISQRIARGVDVGEVRHAIREEMALDLADLVERRLGFGELGGPGLETLLAVARAAAPEFGWHEAAALSAARELQHVFDLRRTGVE